MLTNSKAKPKQSVVNTPKSNTPKAQTPSQPLKSSTDNLSESQEIKSSGGISGKKKPIKQMSNATRESILQMVNSSDKTNVNVVVIGRVDAGKSTTMGHLLYLTGNVDKRVVDKYARDSKTAGKNSFQYAWVLDQDGEERHRGVTIDIAQKHIETKNHRVTLLDCPGHKDFIPNMISGTSQADSSILVVDSTDDGLKELAFDRGQTKEHIILARTLGVNNIIVAVNKLDLNNWEKERFDEVKTTVLKMIKQIGFKEDNVQFIPCSGFLGENLSSRSEHLLLEWYNGMTLLEAIDSLPPPKQFVDLPFRMSVGDFYKDTQYGLGHTVSGKVESGIVGKGDNLLILPSNQSCSVKGIRIYDNSVSYASSGQTIELGVTGLEFVEHGEVLCDPENPISVTNKFEAQLRLFDLDTPILKGHHVILYLQQSVISARLINFISVVENGSTKNKPRMLKSHCTANLIIETDQSVCVDTYTNQGSFGRFALRDGELTIAAGIVTKIL